MQILLISATEGEKAPLLQRLGQAVSKNKYYHNSLVIDTLVTGVGMTATGFALGKQFASKEYDLAINVGVAGAFDRSLKLGQVVEVAIDCFPEMGAENGKQFLSLTELQLQKANAFPFEEDKVLAKLPEEIFVNQRWKKVHGITVNTVHGDEDSIDKISTAFKAEVETMEGAAFFYACRMMDVPCIQLRAISNYVERRNKAAWKLGLAINQLAEETLYLLNEL
jgi:futalosine hydrolase